MAIPIRSCIACRKRESWTNVLRVVVVDGQVIPDQFKRKTGRGAWLHQGCLELAKSRGAFVRAFRTTAPLRTETLEEYVRSLQAQEQSDNPSDS
ncbi:MAG: YlxR family protein [Actinomycetes bacterium]